MFLKWKKISVLEWVRVILFVLFVVIIGYVIVRKIFYITSDQAFMNTKLVALRAPITGVLHALDPKVGEEINQGTVLWEMNNPLYGNTEVYLNDQNLQTLINQVRLEMEQDRIAIKKYGTDLEKYLRLKESGAIAGKDIVEVNKTIDTLKMSVALKQEQLDHYLERQKEVRYQLDMQKKSLIVAPNHGVLWTIVAKDGERLDQGDEIAQIINPRDIWVDAFFNERYAAELHPGVIVKVMALGSKKSWKGTIVFVRGGTGRVAYNAAVEIPPTLIMRRLVAVRVKVDWQEAFPPGEFYGVGRSLVVSVPRMKHP